MNHVIIASIITTLFSIIQYAIHYKNNTKINIKDSAIVFVSSLGGLYAKDYIGMSPAKKMSEVFTAPPAF